ncbi:MAG: dehydrogenase [Bacteroidia bacterium]|nr:dehydrogenase E1 component subunit alpha/beta [Bacteroidia bacterium]NNC86053.1 dehydrogenase [Bacteroidia bacterium]NNM16335.1 dehydrogenase [Bacteroidia bacterium]
MPDIQANTILFDRKKLSNKELLNIYYHLIKPRLIEEKMLLLLRQGKISKWFSGIGQEAISVGSTLALNQDEYILPMHRNLGVFTTRNIPLEKLFAQFQGKLSGFTKGRDRSFHFGTQEFNIVGMISHLGAQLGVADGIALANKLKENNQVVVAYTGDGGASEGDFHEALNVAAVWDLPVLFIVENNGYGLSTPSSEQFRFKNFIHKGPGYGVHAEQCNGNNVLEVYHKVVELKNYIVQKQAPVILECMTFRMRGHEEASGTKYIPQELFEIWGKKDPIRNFENYMLDKKLITEDEKEKYYSVIKEEINKGLEVAFAEELPQANSALQIRDLYAPCASAIELPKGASNSEMRFVDSISDGLKQAMQKHDDLIIMGQDIAKYGGVFKITEGFLEKFGKDRIRNTPICESAIIGAAQGLSIAGFKSVVELQFADFISCGFNQTVNNVAKTHYRWGQKVDTVLRMPTGAGVGAGPFHSQSNEAWFFHTPGLKIVYPAFPADAKGLLIAAIEDPNPVMFFEHKALYRSISGLVPDAYFSLEIGKGKLLKRGEQLTIITYGMGVHWALKALEKHNSISADLIDLRSLVPLDKELILDSVKKTGKAIVLHEDTLTGGIAGEISAIINEEVFEYLDAPVMRVGSLDTPVPMSENLEKDFLPTERFENALLRMASY